MFHVLAYFHHLVAEGNEEEWYGWESSSATPTTTPPTCTNNHTPDTTENPTSDSIVTSENDVFTAQEQLTQNGSKVKGLSEEVTEGHEEVMDGHDVSDEPRESRGCFAGWEIVKPVVGFRSRGWWGRGVTCLGCSSRVWSDVGQTGEQVMSRLAVDLGVVHRI